MWSFTQILAHYGEVAGTVLAGGALLHWMLDDRRQAQLANGATRILDWAHDVRHRRMLDLFARPQVWRPFLAAVFAYESLLLWYFAAGLNYRGTTASFGDVVMGDLLLFVAPLGVAAAALYFAGHRLVNLLTGTGGLFACFCKCIAAVIVASMLAFQALQVMDATYFSYGPRALLAWWDTRLWVYAVEYALSGVIVSGLVIALLLLAACTMTAIVILPLILTLLQAEVVAYVVVRSPKLPLVAGSIALAGLGSVAKGWT
jgi:hypothetical protein